MFIDDDFNVTTNNSAKENMLNFISVLLPSVTSITVDMCRCKFGDELWQTIQGGTVTFIVGDGVTGRKSFDMTVCGGNIHDAKDRLFSSIFGWSLEKSKELAKITTIKIKDLKRKETVKKEIKRSYEKTGMFFYFEGY